MTFNEKVIKQDYEEYRSLYFKNFGVYPKDWFSYLRWLAQSKYLFCGSFNQEECEIAKELFEEAKED